MMIEVLKSKLHCVRVTEANLNYMGSITIDEDLMDAANMIAGEKVHMWKITVTDNGPKISEEIFSALGRPTSTSKKDGLGVGLSIVLSIIENNGGHLTFRRIEPNGIAVDLFVKKKEE